MLILSVSPDSCRNSKSLPQLDSQSAEVPGGEVRFDVGFHPQNLAVEGDVAVFQEGLRGCGGNQRGPDPA
jgi:hypothetical protein